MQQSVGNSSNFTAASSMNLPQMMMMPVHKSPESETQQTSRDSETLSPAKEVVGYDS